jgi:hypothetical protein
LPITPNRCLFMSNETPKRNFETLKVSRQTVLTINRNTMTHAFDKIFSNVNSSGIKKAFDKTGAYQTDQTIDIRFFEKKK